MFKFTNLALTNNRLSATKKMGLQKVEIILLALLSFLSASLSFYALDSALTRTKRRGIVDTRGLSFPLSVPVPFVPKRIDPLSIFPNDALFASNPFLLFAELSLAPALVLMMQSNMGTQIQAMEEKYSQLETLYRSLLNNTTKLISEPKVNVTDFKTLDIIRGEFKEIKSQTLLYENNLSSLSIELKEAIKQLAGKQEVNFELQKQSLVKFVEEKTLDDSLDSKLQSIVENLRKDITVKSAASQPTIDKGLPDRIQKVEDRIEAIQRASAKAKDSNEKSLVGLRTTILALEEKLRSIVAMEIRALKSDVSKQPLPVIDNSVYEKRIQEMSNNVDDVMQQLFSANELISRLQSEVFSLGSSAAVGNNNREEGSEALSLQRLDAIDAQISEFQLLRTSLDKRFLEWTEKLSVMESNIASAVEKKYVDITASVNQMKSELQSIERSLLDTAQKLESKISNLNATQGILLADMNVELSTVKADFSRGLVQLNDMVKSSSMDFDESLEQLDSRQSTAVEQMKAFMSQTVLNSSMKAQALNDRLVELSMQVQSAATAEKSNRQALESEFSTLKKEVSSVFQEIRQEYMSKIDSELVAFNDSFATAISGSESRAQVQLAQMGEEVKTELMTKINTLEVTTAAKIAQVEKSSQNDISNLRADTENEKKVIEGKVEYKVSGLQKDVKRFREEMESMLGDLDDSLESRIVQTVDRLSLRQILKKRFVSLWNAVKKTAATVYMKTLGKLFRKFTQEKP